MDLKGAGVSPRGSSIAPGRCLRYGVTVTLWYPLVQQH